MLSLGTGLLFGLYPALHSTRPDLVSAPQGQQRASPRAPGRPRASAASLVTAQIALSMALLVSAGLFLKSLVNVSRVDLGLDDRPHGDVRSLAGAQRLRAASAAWPSSSRWRRSWRPSPGSVGVGALVPVLAGDNWGTGVTVEGFQAGPDTDTEPALQPGRRRLSSAPGHAADGGP